MTRYPCPCCNFLTFEECPDGTFYICPVCFWEDDMVQNNDPLFVGGANGISLQEARTNFQKWGAIKSEYLEHVRAPLATEHLDHQRKK